MAEKMTLEQVRDAISECAEGRSLSPMRGDMKQWADAITDHLTQPAQAVDAWMTTTEEGDPSMLFFDREEALSYCDEGGEPIPLTRALGNAQAEGWKVPDVDWLADQLCDLRNKWAEGCEANWLETDDNHPDDWMAKELHKRLIAYPTPPQPEE